MSATTDVYEEDFRHGTTFNILLVQFGRSPLCYSKNTKIQASKPSENL
jgi:hypothetical protein